MLGLGIGEILVIVGVALLVVGPEQLPRVLRQLGRWYGQARRAADELRRAFVLEADRQDAADRYAKLRERRERAREQREARTEDQAAEPADPADPSGEPATDGSEPAEEEAESPPAELAPVAQATPFVEPEPLAEGTEPPAADPNADPPDAPHPTRPTPMTREL